MTTESSPAVETPTITDEDILTLDDEDFESESVAIVTGAASGIGRATAICLARNGLTVAATDREPLGETVDAAVRLDCPGTVVPIQADLTVDAELEAIVESAAEHGDVRFLANVAGLQHVAPIADFPMEQYDLMHDVMLRAPVYLSKLCWPHIEESGDGTGAIGNMCSLHGHVATRDKVAYHAVKFGIRGLTAAIAAEGGGDVRSFSVSTGYVKTPLVVDQIPDTAEERDITPEEVVEDVMLGESRVKEMMEPIEVANLFAFGFSRNARHLNGNDLLFDGGARNTYL